MMKLCFALLLSAAFALADDQCSIAFKDDGTALECMATINGSIVQVNGPECSDYSDECCGDGENCYVKAKESGGVGALEKEEDLLDELFSETPKVIKKAKKKEKEAMSRFLALGPLGLPGSSCLPPTPFPAKCEFTRNEPYVLEPPVNVPYCVRIPCSVHNNGPLEKSHKLCGSQPGCYFDKALYEYREAFGESVLPGVPVCQLAIRSKVFHEKAQQVINDYGSWNPYFTNCLLKEYNEELRSGPKGCELLQILDVFFVQPKLAGWSTITSRECGLIDACFRPGFGCFYPVDISRVIVKSGQQRIGFHKNEIQYGRPKCQHFDTSSPLGILKSYHTCLASGCTVDSSVTAMYYNHLFTIGEGLSVKDHWQYWQDVEKGHVGAYNIDEMLGEYNYNPTKVAKPSQLQPPSNTLFEMPGAQDVSNPFLSPVQSGPSFSMPSLPQSLTSGQNRACGHAFRQYNARPCAPLQVSVPKPNSYCPYKPFHVPRFPKLTGKFDGCCEVNLCYLPKSEISQMHSGPSFYYSEWSMFSSCSATCGQGQKRRYRRCISQDKSRCTEPLVQIRSCQEAPCASWTQWGAYTPCPNTCFPGGVQTRTRTCFPSGGRCDGESEQVRTCNQHACGFDTPKGIFTQWRSEGCRYNRQTGMCEETRTRYCTYNGIPGGKCIGSTMDTKKYRCPGCANRG